MLDIRGLIIQHFVQELREAYQQTYNLMEPQFGNILEWTGRLALESIANSDILYHNVEHTIMVTLVGQSILKGKHLRDGGVTPKDWLHVMMALLCHDIGYVKNVCKHDDDRNNRFATGIDEDLFDVPPGGTDAALTPHHVNRSKLFVRERFGGSMLVDVVDAELICTYIETTRYPVPKGDDFYKATSSCGGLVRAADFIGQLGDPSYLRKVPALFYEFEEIGSNKKIGYKSPGHMRDSFTQFYWQEVRPYIQDALNYLEVTQEGKQWIANLHSHVFHMEHHDK
jgi:hypothetical protein